MVDTHFHLDHIEAPPAHVVSRARKAGVDRMLAIGMTGESCRHALAAADKHEEIYVSVGRHRVLLPVRRDRNSPLVRNDGPRSDIMMG